MSTNINDRIRELAKLWDQFRCTEYEEHYWQKLETTVREARDKNALDLTRSPFDF